jgi:radical SAM superfamily enzyme YgiQ (UPF0313 family)
MRTILLVDLPYARGECNEPLAVEFLAAQVIARTTATVEILCLERGFSARWFTDKIRVLRPDLIAFSTKLDSIPVLPVVGEAVRQSGLECSVLIGGIAATLAPQETLSALALSDAICVVGEGEDALCDAVLGLGTAQQRISTSVGSHSRRVIVSPPSVLYPTSAPALRVALRQTLASRGIARCEASRGCPWGNCTFCVIGRKYGTTTWRPRQASAVLDELTQLASMGVEMVYFTDEDFIGPGADRALWIAEQVIARKADGRIPETFRLWCATGVRTIEGLYGGAARARTALVALKTAGLTGVFLGIESGSPTQLARYAKGATVAQNEEVLNSLQELGLETDVGFIMFDPFATLEELEENVTFIRRTSLMDGFSRLGKPVRLTPHMTLTSRSMRHGLCGRNASSDALSYPYKFADARTAAVFNEFSAWEEDTARPAYELQSVLRASGYTTGQASDARERLVVIRREQLDKLAGLIDEAK